MNLPFNAAELSVAALVVMGVIIFFWRLPAIIAAGDGYATNRAAERQREDDSERAAIREANEHSLATIKAQAALIERQQGLLAQAQTFADRILSNEERRDKEREELEAQIAGLRGKYEKLLRVQGQVDELRGQLAASREQAKQDREEMQGEIEVLRQQNRELKGKIEAVEQERDELLGRVQILEAEKAERNGAKKEEEKTA